MSGCPVMKYHQNLMQAILFEKIDIAKAVISLDDAPKGYKDFDAGECVKCVSLIHIIIRVWFNEKTNEKIRVKLLI